MEQKKYEYELFFSDKHGEEDIKLLEIPSLDFIENFRKKDEEGRPIISIKAPTPSSEAVLVDSTNTYSIKIAETSNSNLLLPLITKDSNKKLHIRTTLFSVIELQKMKPNFQPLEGLLAKSYYEGSEYEEDKKDKYSFSDLRELIQASDNELLEELSNRGALEIDGYWRQLKPEYYQEIFKQALLICLSYEISLVDVRASEVYSYMNSYEQFLIDHTLRINSRKIRSEKGEENRYELDPHKIGIFQARQVLKGSKGKLAYQDFVEQWKEAIPQDYCNTKFDKSLLKGIALIEDLNGQEYLSYFPESSLSKAPNERFKQLFARQTKWKFGDICNYLDEITGFETSEQLLLKYAVLDRTDKNLIWVYERF